MCNFSDPTCSCLVVEWLEWQSSNQKISSSKLAVAKLIYYQKVAYNLAGVNIYIFSGFYIQLHLHQVSELLLQSWTQGQ